MTIKLEFNMAEDFFGDILCTAVEGGINYWANVKTVTSSALIDKIVERTLSMSFLPKRSDNALSIAMDITATHANGNPLRLVDLLAADDFNFQHDVFGIYAHLNRRTGKLEDFFVPRYSA